MKIVVFDLDETLGYFTQFSFFWNLLENFLNTYNLSQKEFNYIFDLYPEFLRPNIINILNFLKEKKKTKYCSKIMIYTNNNGSKLWCNYIINYFENIINYKLIDQIISAFKINGKQIEFYRTTHEKTHNDFIRCTKLPKNIEICFIDDSFYPEMLNENVFYICIKPYIYQLDFNILFDRFKKSKLYKKIINDDIEFTYFFNKSIEKSNYILINKNIEEYEIDKILGKEILFNLEKFFNNNNFNITKKKNKKYYKKNITQKNNFIK